MSQKSKRIMIAAITLICIATSLTTFENSAQAGQFPWHKINLTFSGGWGNYDMPNGGTTYESQSFNSFWVFDKIGGGPAFSGQIGYNISKRISIAGAVEYLSGSSVYHNKTQDFLDNYFRRVSPFNGTKFSASIWAFELKPEYVVISKPLSISISPGIAWLQGSTKLPVIDYIQAPNIYVSKKHFTANGLGAVISAAASYRLNRTLSIRNETGFRFFRIRQMFDSNEAQQHEIKINFSGLYVSGGLTFEL